MCKRASKKNDEISLSSFPSTSMMHPLHPHLSGRRRSYVASEKRQREREKEMDREITKWGGSSPLFFPSRYLILSRRSTVNGSLNFFLLFSSLLSPSSLHPSFHLSVREQERSDETRFKSLYNTQLFQHHERRIERRKEKNFHLIAFSFITELLRLRDLSLLLSFSSSTFFR